MQVRNTLIMALVLVLLAGFVYFYEIRGREAREEAERREELLVVFEPEEVTRLSLQTEGEPVVAERTEDGWRIVEPRPVPADDAALDGLVDDLSRATKDRLIAEAAEDLDLGAYGLADPQARVTITLEDGSELAVAVGKDTPLGSNLYATTGSGDVYSAPRALRGQVGKSLLELRDRSILSFARDEVQRVELRRGDLQARLEREGATGEEEEPRWRATTPFEGRADVESVQDILDAVGTEEVEAFVHEDSPTPEELAGWGLAEPTIEITVWTADDASQRLLVGGESEEPEGFHAMRGGGDSVFVVPDAVVDALPTDADALRNRAVLDISRSRVSALEIRRGDAVIGLERDDADWRVTAPRALGADSSRVSQLLGTLVDLRADGFATDAEAEGLETPELSVIATLGVEGEGETRTVRLDVGGATTALAEDAEEGAEPAAARYVRTSDDPTVYVVLDEELDDLRVDLFDVRDKTLVEFSQADLTDLTLTVGGDDQIRLVKDGEDWSVAEPPGASLEDEELVADLLWDLNYLRMEGIAAETEDTTEPASFGLQPPAYRIVARVGDEAVADVSVGDPAAGTGDEGGRVYVAVEGMEGVYEVYAGLRDTLAALVEGIGSP